MSDYSAPKLRLAPPSGLQSPAPASSVPDYLIPSTTEKKVDSEYNIAIGVNALVNNSNISYNMIDGNYSLSQNLTGVNNTAVGDSSLHNTKGKNNTALGYKTGISNIVGNNNTFLGNSADCVAHDLNNSTAIGYTSKITASNQIVLGNNDTTQVFIPSETASIQLGSTLLDQAMINSFASETYVDSAISGLKAGAGSAFDTLKEIADIIGNDSNVAGTLVNSISLKAPINSPSFTGRVTVVDISGVTQTMVGLGNVNNTSDASKPISALTQNALNLKAPINNPSFTGTVGGVTQSMVGLGNVNNTSDASKPISALTQNALNLKAPINNPSFTGTVGGVTQSMVGLGNVDNTSDAAKPVSTATQTALDLKAPINSPSFTGTVVVTDISGVTQTMVGLGNVDNTSDSDKVNISGPIKDALDSKVDATTFNTLTASLNLDSKVNVSDFTQQLLLKADVDTVNTGLDSKADSSVSAHYYYESQNGDLDLIISSPNDYKIYNIVNVTSSIITITYGTEPVNSITLNQNKYASFIHYNSTWYNVTY